MLFVALIHRSSFPLRDCYFRYFLLVNGYNSEIYLIWRRLSLMMHLWGHAGCIVSQPKVKSIWVCRDFQCVSETPHFISFSVSNTALFYAFFSKWKVGQHILLTLVACWLWNRQSVINCLVFKGALWSFGEEIPKHNINNLIIQTQKSFP